MARNVTLNLVVVSICPAIVIIFDLRLVAFTVFAFSPTFSGQLLPY